MVYLQTKSMGSFHCTWCSTAENDTQLPYVSVTGANEWQFHVLITDHARQITAHARADKVEVER